MTLTLVIRRPKLLLQRSQVMCLVDCGPQTKQSASGFEVSLVQFFLNMIFSRTVLSDMPVLQETMTEVQDISILGTNQTYHKERLN
uniref:Uncharacterized protein n=1 Tax=Arion vulgaris TaxID=1028688 RepID=A0A0B6ZEM2_9EUPU